MDDLLKEFLAETAESLPTLDADLVALEHDPHHPARLARIFRLVHTIKGACGFLGFSRLEAIAHTTEDVLGRLRDGRLEATPELISLVLAALDRIKSILAALEETGAEPEGDDAALIRRLTDLAGGSQAPARPPRPRKAEPDRAATPAGPPPDPERSTVASQSIRVPVDRLEDLMSMVSELVLTRNEIARTIGRERPGGSASLQRLNHVTAGLRDAVMKTRMRPIGGAWTTLPRVVRDLAVQLGKKIDLETYGGETEMDRQVLEVIKDPLIHIVRNAADHGLESPDERLRAGKPETGRIVLSAYHEAGDVVVEIADDGRGIDLDAVRARALSAGLGDAEEIEAMSEARIQRFIFASGFSTAGSVTGLSGRGIGMDVVKTNIESIGGTIEVVSRAGKGVTFVIRVPLTLAIMPAMIVACCGERFAVPQASAVEVVRLRDGTESRIEYVHDVPLLRRPEGLLPVVLPRRLLRLDADGEDEGAFVLILRSGALEFGLLVDRVLGFEEIVVKPLARILRGLPVFTGSTILGDGGVVLILDPHGIAGAAGISAPTDRRRAGATPPPEGGRRAESVPLLLFQAGDDAPKAIPLARVSRIEEVRLEAIEHAAGAPAVRCGGRLIPIAPLGPHRGLSGRGRRKLVILGDGDRVVGLLADHVFDVVEHPWSPDFPANRPGLVGGAVVDGRPTELIDAEYYLERWYRARPREPETVGAPEARGAVPLTGDAA